MIDRLSISPESFGRRADHAQLQITQDSQISEIGPTHSTRPRLTFLSNAAALLELFKGMLYKRRRAQDGSITEVANGSP